MSTNLLVAARWRKHSEIPTVATTAIIAVPGDAFEVGCDQPFVLPEMYYFYPDRSPAWKSEVSDESLRHQRFWWLPDGELTLSLPVGKA